MQHGVLAVFADQQYFRTVEESASAWAQSLSRPLFTTVSGRVL